MMQPPHDAQTSKRHLQRITLAQRILDIIVIGAGMGWFALIQLRWIIFGYPPTWLDAFVGVAFIAMGGALWLNHRSRAAFNRMSQSEDLRRQLEDVMSSMADIMIVMSPEGNIQRVNKATLDGLGYTREEMVGQSINHFMVQGGKQTALDVLNRAGSVRLTRSFRTHAGRLIPMAVTYTAVTARDGTLQGVLCVAQELTEVEAMRVKLQSTSERYNTAITSSRLGVYEYDPHTNHLVVDSSLSLLVKGQSLEIKTLDDALIHIPIEDHAKVYTALNHVLTGKADHVDLEIRLGSAKDGLRWLHVRGAINQSDGRLFGTLMDVTDRKAAEDALESRDSIMSAVASASETFLHSPDWQSHLDELLEKLGEAANVSRVYVFRKHLASDGRTMLVSQVAEWCDEDAIPQINNPDLQNIDLIKIGFERWLRVLGANESMYGNLETFPRSEQDFLGRQGILSLLVTPIFVNNEWWGLIGFDDCKLPRVWAQPMIDALKLAADILGAAIFRTEADKELESGRDFILNIMNNLGQGVTMVNAQSKLLYVNPAYAQMIGLSPDELLGRSPAEFTLPEDLQTLEYHRAMRSKGLVSSYSSRLQHIEGHFTEVLITGVPRLVNGKYDGAYCVVADVTERRKLEAQRLEVMLEKERIRLMSDFVRDISHEFRTPLSIIQTSLYLLRRKPDSPQILSRLDVIGQQSQRLNRLVDDLMLMLELEQAEIVARLLSLNTLAQHVKTQMAKRAEDKNQTLTLEEPNGQIFVRGEEGYLARAVIMLMENAIEFTPDGGNITLRVHSDQGRAALSVTDTGVGIPAEELDNIFEHMYKVDKSRNTERGGLGLGLSIVRRISAMHHGEVAVQSEPGVGSTFTLYFPYPDRSKTKPVATMTQEISAVVIRATDEIDRATT